jgi:ATP-dependent Clp protease ATP-binding subunit ClpA
MADISLEAVTGKLNRVGYEAFIQALRQAKGAGNRNLELAHWVTHVLQKERSDITLTADHFKLDRAKLLMDLGDAIRSLRQNQTEMPEISDQVQELLDGGWYYATLLFGETQTCARWTARVCAAPARRAPRTRPGRAARPRSTGSHRISPRRRHPARWTRFSGATRKSARSSMC